MIVADASPLIVFAKLQRLSLLNQLYGKVLIGAVVKGETIDSGKAVRARGVEQLEAAWEEGWLETVGLAPEERSLMQRLTRHSHLDQGEAESIALASVRGLRLIVDDKAARGVAAAAEVEHCGTVGVLLEAHLRQHLDLGELEATLRNLTQTLWLSPAVVAEALRLAREASR